VGKPMTATTGTRDVPLPSGARAFHDWEPGHKLADGEWRAFRLIYGRESRLGSHTETHVRAFQFSDGTIYLGIGDPSDGPVVIVEGGSDNGFTSAQARQLAAQIIEAAHELDRWTSCMPRLSVNRGASTATGTRTACRPDQACWSPSEYVNLSLHAVHHEKGGDYPQSLGVMVRKEPDHPGAAYLHVQDIQLRGPIPQPHKMLDHSLNLTPDESTRLGEALTGRRGSCREPKATH
jgi:hypothetical protein